MIRNGSRPSNNNSLGKQSNKGQIQQAQNTSGTSEASKRADNPTHHHGRPQDELDNTMVVCPFLACFGMQIAHSPYLYLCTAGSLTLPLALRCQAAVILMKCGTHCNFFRFFRPAAAAHTLAHAHFGARSQPWKTCTRKGQGARGNGSKTCRSRSGPTNPEPTVHKELNKHAITVITLYMFI